MSPRHYAQYIMGLKTKDERRAALDRVPEHFRELTRKHVEIEFERRKYINRA